MSDESDPRPLAPDRLRSELERSRDDLVRGRLSPLRSVLTGLHGRALRRIEKRRQAAFSEPADAG